MRKVIGLALFLTLSVLAFQNCGEMVGVESQDDQASCEEPCEEPTPTVAATPTPPPIKSCESVTLLGDTVPWGEYWYESFPGPSYENVTNEIVPQYGYLAIEFNTGDIDDDGSITALENPATPGIRYGSISQCAGDFDVADNCSYTWGLGGGIRWATNGRAGACQLLPNTTYFFNITFTDGVSSAASNCNATPCRVNLQHANLE